MLTLQMLKDMPPNTVFATGVVPDSPEGINMMNTGNDLRWCAQRGQIYDWTIYTHWATSPLQYVKNRGDKVFSAINIKRLVPCDDEAFKMYRY